MLYIKFGLRRKFGTNFECSTSKKKDNFASIYCLSLAKNQINIAFYINNI